MNAEFGELNDSWADGIWKKGWEAAREQIEREKEQIARDKERFEKEREQIERDKVQIERSKEQIARDILLKQLQRRFPDASADELNAVRDAAIGTAEQAALLLVDPQTSLDAVLAVLREPGELQPDRPPSSSPDSSSGAGDQNG